MEHVEMMGAFLFLFVLLFCAGLVGFSWVTTGVLLLVMGYFLIDFHSSTKNWKIVDMVNMLAILLAVVIGASFVGLI
ncbi:MAG: hypothetical protein WC775_00355 [Patescibacteria group bacterium]|jgi:hypothetical protein